MESPSQASQTFEESSDNFAELHHTLCSCQMWALLSLKQHKQKTGHNLVQWPVKLNVRRCARRNLVLRLPWSFEVGFQSPLQSFSGLWINCTCTSASKQFLILWVNNFFKVFLAWGMAVCPAVIDSYWSKLRIPCWAADSSITDPFFFVVRPVWPHSVMVLPCKLIIGRLKYLEHPI